MLLIITVIIIAAAAYSIFRSKITSVKAGANLPSAYAAILYREVGFYQKLDKSGKARFEQLAGEFLQDVRIEGVGTEITDIDSMLIASSAVIPIFGFPGWKYKNLTNIILYPDAFDKDFQFEGESRNILGMVGSGYMNGQMLLSRAALVKGFSKNSGKENTAIHEFVHLLDKADGATDGVPESLMAHEYTVPWLKMMHQEMHRIQEGKSDIDPYALTNEAEFLAVAAEYFFEKPEKFKQMHPKLYDMLSLIFEQEPATKFGKSN